MGRRAIRRIVIVVALLGVALVVASLDWRPARTAGVGEPHALGMTSDIRGGLLAGAAEIDVTPERPMPLGGFAARRGRAFESVRDPVRVRALAVSSSAGGPPVVLVSLDTVLVPTALAGRIRERVWSRIGDRVDLVVTATHTHAGPGGLWDGWLAALAGMGRYDGAFVDGLVDATVEAVARAVSSQRPVRLLSVEGEGPAICDARRAGRAADRRLTVMRLVTEVEAEVELEGENEDEDENEDENEEVDENENEVAVETLARIVIYACHPTFLGHRDRRVSAEWPGEAARHLDGITLMLQGAVGDQRPAGFGLSALGLEAADGHDPSTPEGRMVAAGTALAAAVRRLEAGARPSDDQAAWSLLFQSVDVHLPAATGETVVPFPFRPLAGNVLARAAPSTVRLSLLRIGDRRLVFAPGEVVSELASRWEVDADVRVVSLADGYMGYLETPEALAAGGGESEQSYFGADALEVLGTGVDRLLSADARR